MRRRGLDGRSTVRTINISFREHHLARKNFVASGASEAVLVPLLLECRDTHSVDWPSTLSTNGSPPCVVVFLTIREAFVLKELSIRKRFAASGAGKVVSVPVLVECSNCRSVHNRLVTLCASVPEKLVVVLQTVRVLVFLIELSVCEGLVANCTAEAVLVEVLSQSLQVASLYHLAAARATWKERALVAVETVSSCVLVKELLRPDVSLAAAAAEALKVVKCSQSLQCVSINVLSTHSTTRRSWRSI